MTEEELAMQLAEIRKPFWSWERWSEHSKNGFRRQARWHISELKKAGLRARIDELGTLGGDIEENNADHDLQVVYQERDDRIHQYQSELRQLEEGQ